MTGPGIYSYSTTPANNVQSNTGINWDEGMPPAAVNNSARQNMTDLRNAFNDLVWFKYGKGDLDYSPVYASSTSFTIAGIDVTAPYHTGRRVKAVGSGTGTIYGSISSSVFGTNTTVNVTWDSGSLSNETLTVYLSQIPVTGDPVASAAIQGLSITVGKAFSVTNSLTLAGTDGTTITFQGTDTYVGRTTTDSLTNKSLSGGSISLAADIISTSINGPYVRFSNNGTPVGDYGCSSAIFSGGGVFDVGINVRGDHRVVLGVNSVPVLNVNSAAVEPWVDNTYKCGNSNTRWTTIYAATGTINTSDESEKKWRGSLTNEELSAGKEIFSEIGGFKFLDAIAVKGGESARLHIGVRAQRVKAILEAHGLDAMSYGFLCYDEWDEIPATPEIIDVWKDENGEEQARVIPAFRGRQAGGRYGLRPDELCYFLMAVMDRRLAAFEAA